MKYSAILMGLCLITASACNSGGNGGGDTASNPTERRSPPLPSTSSTDRETGTFKITKKRKTLLKKDFSNFTQYKENLNKFILVVEAESGNFMGSKVECRKELFDRDNAVFGAPFNHQGTQAEVEVSIDAKNPMQVNFDCRITDREVELGYGSISIRKSFVVSGLKSAFAMGLGIEKVESLVLDKGATLLTDGSLFVLDANEFVSNQGKIITFQEETTATTPDNEAGVGGGIIHINTQNAIGELTVELRGKDGGKQQKIPGMNPQVPAADKALDGKCYGSEFRIDPNKLSCWGRIGHRGYKGFKGYEGLEGGSSGSFQFKSSNESNLKLKVLYFPGKGSDGGAGGAGGKGGPGGKGSFVAKDNPDVRGGTGGCPRCLKSSNSVVMNGHQYPDGKEGAQGEQGDNGEGGKDGAMEFSTALFLYEDMKFNFNYNWLNY